jgi:hypothetical protein
MLHPLLTHLKRTPDMHQWGLVDIQKFIEPARDKMSIISDLGRGISLQVNASLMKSKEYSDG